MTRTGPATAPVIQALLSQCDFGDVDGRVLVDDVFTIDVTEDEPKIIHLVSEIFDHCKKT